MKMHILTTAILLLSVLGAMAQGYINFSTRVSGSVVGHVYAPVPGEYVRLQGNTASETPAGAQNYFAPWLEGTGFYAQLFVDTGSGFVAVPGSLTTFRTGPTLGGTVAPLVLAVPGVPRHGTGTFQVRAWHNGGNAALQSYDLASTRGFSDPFVVNNLGDGVLDFPADMVNFRSFNLTGAPLPEPATMAILALGAAGLWIFRRKQPVA